MAVMLYSIGIMTDILTRPTLSLNYPEQVGSAHVARLSRLAGEMGVRLSFPDPSGLERVYYPDPHEVFQDYDANTVDAVSVTPGLWLPAITRSAAHRYVTQDRLRRRNVTRVVNKLLERAGNIAVGDNHWLASYILRDPLAPNNVLGLDAENAAVIASHSDDLHTLGLRAGVEPFQEYTAALRKAQ